MIYALVLGLLFGSVAQAKKPEKLSKAEAEQLIVDSARCVHLFNVSGFRTARQLASNLRMLSFAVSMGGGQEDLEELRCSVEAFGHESRTQSSDLNTVSLTFELDKPIDQVDFESVDRRFMHLMGLLDEEYVKALRAQWQDEAALRQIVKRRRKLVWTDIDQQVCIGLPTAQPAQATIQEP